VDAAKRIGMAHLAGADETCEVRKHAFFGPIDFVALVRKDAPAPYVPTIRSMTDLSNFDPTLKEPDVTPFRELWDKKLHEEPYFDGIFREWAWDGLGHGGADAAPGVAVQPPVDVRDGVATHEAVADMSC
jgi:hypothetical protein